MSLSGWLLCGNTQLGGSNTEQVCCVMSLSDWLLCGNTQLGGRHTRNKFVV